MPHAGSLWYSGRRFRLVPAEQPGAIIECRTIATIGFVNAGLLGIHQALGIVLGATVGTTMTGWLVAVVGFQFSISAFAMPMLSRTPM